MRLWKSRCSRGPIGGVMPEYVGHVPHLEREREVNDLILNWLQTQAGN